MNCIICNHEEYNHEISIFYTGLTCCGICYTVDSLTLGIENGKIPTTSLCYHRFNDNLTYIERLAKERNLI